MTTSSKKGSSNHRPNTEDQQVKNLDVTEPRRVKEMEDEVPEPEPVPAQTTVDDDIAAKFGASAARKFASKAKTTPPTNDGGSNGGAKASEEPAKEKKPKREKTYAISNEQMILVTVNDRLGTKAQVPCLASDTVKNFKMLVANRIGRHPHEIMIKRQGHKPFKDALTLADYEVSNGVQLDLELNTGD